MSKPYLIKDAGTRQSMQRAQDALARVWQEDEGVPALLREVYENARVIRTGKHLTTVNELCDQVPALRTEVLMTAIDQVMKFGTFGANKLLTEEDKGAAIATGVALATRLPLCMARWYPYDIEGQAKVQMKCEYFEGTLYLNGINPGDRVFIVEDTLSTGGTMIALIEAVRKAGADIAGAVALVEKVSNEGHDNVWLKTGVDVKTCMQINVTEAGVEVL